MEQHISWKEDSQFRCIAKKASLTDLIKLPFVIGNWARGSYCFVVTKPDHPIVLCAQMPNAKLLVYQFITICAGFFDFLRYCPSFLVFRVVY